MTNRELSWVFTGIIIGIILFIMGVIVRDLGRKDMISEIKQYGCEQVIKSLKKEG